MYNNGFVSCKPCGAYRPNFESNAIKNVKNCKMKKMIFMAALMVSCAAAAQVDNKTVDRADQQRAAMQARNHLTMKEGKMWMTRDGKTMAMDKDMTLDNGTVVTLSGKVTNRSGQTITLGNGEMVDMNGDRVSQMTREPKR